MKGGNVSVGKIRPPPDKLISGESSMRDPDSQKQN